MKSTLSIDDYDEKGNIRPGLVTIFIFIYCSRYLFLGPLSILAKRAGNFGNATSLDTSFLTNISPFLMISSIPSVLLLYLVIYRSEESSKFMKYLWRKGKAVLIISILGQISINLSINMEINVNGWPNLVILALNLYLIFFIFKSEKLKLYFINLAPKK